jgi:hypothetical protein
MPANLFDWAPTRAFMDIKTDFDDYYAGRPLRPAPVAAPEPPVPTSQFRTQSPNSLLRKGGMGGKLAPHWLKWMCEHIGHRRKHMP